jgi:hypothetical protein
MSKLGATAGHAICSPFLSLVVTMFFGTFGCTSCPHNWEEKATVGSASPETGRTSVQTSQVPGQVEKHDNSGESTSLDGECERGSDNITREALKTTPGPGRRAITDTKGPRLAKTRPTTRSHRRPPLARGNDERITSGDGGLLPGKASS